MIFYDKRNGFIDAVAPSLSYADNYPEDLKNNLVGLKLDEYPDNIFDYIVTDGNLVKMTDVEIKEKREHGRFLDEEERLENELLERLKPTIQELEKAKDTISTIELLILFREVMLSE